MTRCKATCLKLLINGNDALHSLEPLPHGRFMTTIVRGNGRYHIHLAQTADVCRYAYRDTPTVLRIGIGLTRFSRLLCPICMIYVAVLSCGSSCIFTSVVQTEMADTTDLPSASCDLPACAEKLCICCLHHHECSDVVATN